MHYTLIALSLGFAGSLHCIGMCGPLVSALHSGLRIGLAQKGYYHVGRSLGYSVWGAIAGAMGHSIRWAATQQSLAIVAGLLLLLMLLAPLRTPFSKKVTVPYIGRWRQSALRWWRTGSPTAAISLGVLNAWLPCGMVYAALAAAAITASAIHGAVFMCCFGLANTPALWLSTHVMHRVQQRFSMRQHRRIHTLLTLFALLVMLRGAGLGIPYISPTIEANVPVCCHR